MMIMISRSSYLVNFFFFQAEDGIRDLTVTGVQTCALPILAMLTTGHSWVPRLRPYAASGRLRVGFVGIPHRAGVRPVTVIYASGYAVPAIAARRKLSIELAADLTDSLADGARGEAGLELPALTTAAQALVPPDTLGWEAAFVRAAAVGRMPGGPRIERWRGVGKR